MQVSIKWLKDYIDFEQSPEQLADMLTMAGVPVENIHYAGEGIEKVITGRITAVEKHPDADKLSICTLDVGAPENIIIVTGAGNVAPGQVVPVAMIGAKLPNGTKISKGKLRGVTSNGMLCSAGELKLDLSKLTEEQKTGIFILPSETALGLDIKDVLGMNEVVLEFELTANRADCFSVLGLAREVAVLTGGKVKKPLISAREDEPVKTADLLSVKIEAADLCSRFTARVLKNVKIFPSPEWIVERLEGAGIRSINNVVDVTNFVMLELGQPMHAYDYELLSGHKLIARRANEGETLTTLDDSKRTLSQQMLVIADEIQAAGLAGVMGGLVTEVTEATRTVVLEAASFNGSNIRRTARACGLHSEASGRFERGIDVTNCQRALDRAAQLLQNMGACTVCEGFVDAYPVFKPTARVEFTAAQINQHLGADIPQDTMINILRSLEFEITEAGDKLTALVPSWRDDVRVMADISEEISRIYGFDNIKSTMPWGEIMQGGQMEYKSFVDRVRHALAEVGLSETISFSFTHEKMYDALNIPQDDELRLAVPIMNPITEDFPLLRTTLLSSVMENVARNLSRDNNDIRIFEIGTVFAPKELPVTVQPLEKLKLAGALVGSRYPVSWNNSRESVDFYDAKGVLEALFDRLGIAKYTVEAGTHYAMHPGKTALFKKGRDVIGCVGEIHPKVLENLDISKKVYLFEVDMETVLKYASKTPKYTALPKYPASYRDLAFTIAETVTAAEVEKAIVKTAGSLLKGIDLFDLYTGKQIAAGHKSMAFSLQFQSGDKTLTDEDVDKYYRQVVEMLESKFAAKLRA